MKEPNDTRSTLSQVPRHHQLFDPRSWLNQLVQRPVTIHAGSMAEVNKKVNYAVVYSEPPSLRTEVVELPIPEPGPGKVLVRL